MSLSTSGNGNNTSIEDDLLIFDDDDALCFVDDEASQDSVEMAPWNVLIVDDDEDVLLVTQLAFSGLEVLGRPIHLIHAHSFQSAQEILSTQDCAVVITDAIMETEDAGLRLIDWVSHQQVFFATRLVLRTGQPGRFQENVILRDYKIHDYWPKTELTASRMRTILMGLIRSYQDIQSLIQPVA